MGVAGLWKLLLPIGRRISLETLDGKVLAIDASIWWIQLEQALRRRNSDGEGINENSSATFSLLIKLFLHRLCKLKFYNIRPVFVLDGKTPEIKLRTLRQRRKQQGGDESYERSERHLQRIAKQLLQKQFLASQSKVAKTKATSNRRSGPSDSDKQSSATTHTKATSSFAPGFDPGAQHKQATEHVAQQLKSPPAWQQPQDEEVVVLRDEDELPEELSTSNDWDDDGDDDDTYGPDDFGEADDQRHTNSIKFDTGMYQKQQSMTDQVQSVWRLPSHERKAALEQMQRQYRLQSRKEFMPAAAQPQSFSQVQLKHFLKSCQLRQAIVQQQQSVTANDSSAPGGYRKKRKLWGQPTAYDRSIRVELIREDAHSKIDREFSQESEEGGFLRPSHDKRKSDEAGSSLRNNMQGPLGGFMAKTKRTRLENTLVTAMDASVTAASMTNELVNRDDLDVVVDPDTQMFQDQQLAEALQSVEYEEHEDDDSHLENYADERESNIFVWQEQSKKTLNDAKLSQSPVEMNYDSDIEWEDGDATDDTKCQIWKIDDETVKNRNDISEKKQPVSDPIEAKDGSDIEWEEGDAKEACRRKYSFSLQSGKTIEQVMLDKTNAGDPEPGQDDSDDEEVQMVYEASTGVIEKATGKVSALSSDTTPTSFQDRASMLPDIEKKDSGQGKNDSLITKPVPVKKTRSFNSEDYTTGVASKVFETVPGNISNTEALEQAQKTASNLANWAGRVFRRAMKEVSEDSFEPNDKARDEVESSARAAVTNANPVQDASTSTKEPRLLDIAGTCAKKAATLTNPSVTSEQSAPKFSRTFTWPSESLDPSAFAPHESQLDDQRSQQQRDESTGTGEMRDEMRETLLQLLRFFGVPYVEAPAEAEAQCVELERLGLVDGIVTEDSDAFVFGGNTIYKNMFDEMKYVEVYRASDAEKEMSLGRNEMVALAMLLGGDYTEGVRGVGIVNAMEVLDAFDMSRGPKQGLMDFHNWLTMFNPIEDAPSEAIRRDEASLSRLEEFSRKHRSAKTRWETPGNFPSDRVIAAYMSPVVDNSSEKFSWGTPDVENLVHFCSQYIGWSREETIKVLEPVTKKASSRYHQTRIDSFMRYEDSIKFAKVRSRRLRKVLGLDDQESDTLNTPEV
ncbi:DNA excision repair protein ERCC-5 [Fistulifera solaris]|uniref:DNA excision repair protein ERCC-5 n=1 Tax=Fistulifera solaris TaxID=1519565 RepID=A0A1Z5KHK5_FISSO|nr:DNA excision repair protein ERCC-5 [Fistulifera solaris]|eukprot:GAX25697.1 DNA excision repair protein ERCC-5 [Fistulifera solaris]